MPPVAQNVVKARAARLRARGAERLGMRLDRHVGATEWALMESGGRARLPDFAPVRIQGGAAAPGRLVKLTLTGRTDTELLGHPA